MPSNLAAKTDRSERGSDNGIPPLTKHSYSTSLCVPGDSRQSCRDGRIPVESKSWESNPARYEASWSQTIAFV